MGDVCASERSWQGGSASGSADLSFSTRKWVRICMPARDGPMSFNRDIDYQCPHGSRCASTDPFAHPDREDVQIRSIWCEQYRPTAEGGYYFREWLSPAESTKVKGPATAAEAQLVGPDKSVTAAGPAGSDLTVFGEDMARSGRMGSIVSESGLSTL